MTAIAQHLPAFIRRDWFSVGNGQQLHLAQFGNPKGIPLLYLHGGPGAGVDVSELTLFAPEQFWILLLDQRGAGQSQPSAELEHNHLNGLICDIETIRQQLGIERWCLVGGSFGATLALVYSGLFPERVIAQVLWALFIPSQNGIEWLYGKTGAAKLFPHNYSEFTGGALSLELLFEDYRARLNSPEPRICYDAARRWLQWELTLADLPTLLPLRLSSVLLSLARIQLHFVANNYFNMFDVLQRVIPKIGARTLLFQGTADAICPPHLLEAFLGQITSPNIEVRSLIEGGHSLKSEAISLAVMLEIKAMGDWVKQQHWA
ncbi:alpha/beta fold hydrolase [Shewanella acanthi]|uniref:alpha/beta fold hydrolase n=1 Tax=Shewanella acanthi TaxID=2864212 RepID=UPI001C658FCA|nr:alpha/beta fold hydrolase [Shewanella acanthi]QYJ79101.1 alpha/beta fold hydrolase [Shewanella acanthi]